MIRKGSPYLLTRGLSPFQGDTHPVHRRRKIVKSLWILPVTLKPMEIYRIIKCKLLQ